MWHILASNRLTLKYLRWLFKTRIAANITYKVYIVPTSFSFTDIISAFFRCFKINVKLSNIVKLVDKDDITYHTLHADGQKGLFTNATG